MIARKPFIVGLGGTTRVGSTSEKALTVALARARALGAEVRAFTGVALAFEPYDPAIKLRSSPATLLIEALREADGVIIATPGYHGSISGLIKNALDYTEDMRGDTRPYLEGRAVGCIVCADGTQALGSTVQAVRSIVHALRGWPTPLAALINSTSGPFSPNGEVSDAAVECQLHILATQVVDFARMQQLRVVPDHCLAA